MLCAAAVSLNVEQHLIDEQHKHGSDQSLWIGTNGENAGECRTGLACGHGIRAVQ